LITRGIEYEFDAIIFATGFDAMTGTLLRINIEGKSGQTLQDKWSAGPRTYLGLSMADFPNLFTISGPGSPSVLSNMIVTIEQHVNWIMDCVEYMRDKDLATIEANVEAEDAWVNQGNELANMTLMPKCNSWYLGANVPGKPRISQLKDVEDVTELDDEFFARLGKAVAIINFVVNQVEPGIC